MALKVHHLRPAPGAKTAKTRVGRGLGSKGKTAGRGTKGTKARYQVPDRFEGGQMPLHMRLPKLRGFTNRFRVEYQVVNLGRLAELYPSGGEVTAVDLAAKGAVRAGEPVKVLGDGELSVALQVSAHGFSRTAQEKIEAAGGSVTGSSLLSSLEKEARVLSAFAQAFRTPDLRKKLLFTLSIIGLFRLGSVVPTPGVSYTAIQTCLDQVGNNSTYQLINLFSGGALLQLSIFALGIMPYITSSIIVQLLVVVIPRFEALKQEGQSGTARLTQYTRYLTVGLAVLQSTALVAVARNPGTLFPSCQQDLVPNESLVVIVTMIVTMTAGTAVIMWLGELITDRGIGNGMSILIFTSIIARFPAQIWTIYQVKHGFAFGVVIALGLALVAMVVFIEQAQRRIPVQYAKRMVGRRMYGGTSTYIPLKVNMAGVIPVIFASSLLYIPYLLVQLFGNQTNPTGWAAWVSENFIRNGGAHPIYILAYFGLIMFFCYFYVAITFNPEEVADNMKKYGGFIPGIRAGRPTAEYLDYVLTRLTFPGSIYLGIIAVLPIIALALLNASGQFPFGGTSILIMVGVGLDTVKQIQSQLQQRNYEGFLR